jgi:hypothetical protein
MLYKDAVYKDAVQECLEAEGVRFTKKMTHGWRDHRASHTAANVHSLDGYTCQGTPSLMDGPQIKSSYQVEPPVHAWKPQP